MNAPAIQRVLCLALIALGIHKAPASIVDGAEEASAGWLHSEWFGYILPAGEDWYYHTNWGWIYEMGDGTASAWVYVNDQRTWYWMGQSTYPYIYNLTLNSWEWFWKETTDPRLTYNYAINGWLASDGSEGLTWHAYYLSIEDARIAEADEICRTLEPITYYNERLLWNPERTMIRVVSWMPATYINSYVPGAELEMNWETWVSLCPQAQDFALAYKAGNTPLALRMKQVLGLRPDRDYAYWVEFLVRPQDLFRPSADPFPGDCEAELSFPDSPEQSVSESYKAWYYAKEQTSYVLSRRGFPWTRLGYTYDWGNPQSEFGLCEYVIRPGSTVFVDGVYTNTEYLVR